MDGIAFRSTDSRSGHGGHGCSHGEVVLRPRTRQSVSGSVERRRRRQVIEFAGRGPPPTRRVADDVFCAPTAVRLKGTHNGIDSFTITLQVLSGRHYRRVLANLVQPEREYNNIYSVSTTSNVTVSLCWHHWSLPLGGHALQRPPHQRILIQDSVEVIH